MDNTKESICNTNNEFCFETILPKEIVPEWNCITGYNDYFVHYLRYAFKKAKSIDIIVSLDGCSIKDRLPGKKF